MLNQLKKTADFLQAGLSEEPVAGIVLGTGLGGLTDRIEVQHVIPYDEIPGFPSTTVEGHSGNLILGKLSGLPVSVLQGRFHYYEGYGMQQVTFSIRVLKLLGIKQLLISNAAGGINPDFRVGDLMLIRDHINFFPENPLRGPNLDEMGPRFPDMSEPYDRDLAALAHEAATRLGIRLMEGVYVGNPGPCFETPAEYSHYRIIGGDAVGMSTVPEVIVARHMNVPVLGISVITNMSVPGSIVKATHTDVQVAAAQSAAGLAALFEWVVGASPYSIG